MPAVSPLGVTQPSEPVSLRCLTKGELENVKRPVSPGSGRPVERLRGEVPSGSLVSKVSFGTPVGEGVPRMVTTEVPLV